MERLYYENPYQKEFTAEVINVIEKDNNYHVELDKTCFYPEGGGQPSDTGYINSIPVSYVYEENGTVYHVVDTKPLKIHRVKCSINWKRRFDYMQQHLGQHILSACFFESLKASTIGFHLGESYTTIDIDKVLSSEEIQKVEEMASSVVFDNIPVEILYPTKSELKKLPLRKAIPKTDEQIRIVRVGEIDINACCGTHPSSTIEVQVIKIVKWEKYKNGTRVYFLCGSRAVSDYSVKHAAIDRITSILSCSIDSVLSEVERLKGELNKALSEKASLKADVAQYEAKEMLDSSESIENIKIVKLIHNNTDLKDINSLATKLTAFPNVVVLFGSIAEDKSHLVFMRSKDLNIISMNTLLKDAITLIDGRGGGNDFSAQGGGKNNNNLDSAINYAYSKVKEAILNKSK